MMDSASSGSMQSSSGGGGGGGGFGGGERGGDNEEYESHGGELMSSFLRIPDLPSPKPQHQSTSPQQQQPPSPNFFDFPYMHDSNFQQNANFHPNFGNFSSTSLASSTSQSLTIGSQSNSCNYNNINQASSSIHLLSANEESNNNDNNNSSEYKRSDERKTSTGIKNNSKKRSRASRRAPTTVLTTDTINFRQMVQEFTGIPAPPFITGGGFDLFSRSGGSTMRASHQRDALGSSYPLRPSPQKVSSSLLNARFINARRDFGLPPNLKQPHQNDTEGVFNNMQNLNTFQPLQESTISPVFYDRSHGSSSMVAPPTDLDGLAGMHSHHR